MRRIKSLSKKGHTPLVLLEQAAWTIPVIQRKGRVDRFGPFRKRVIDQYSDDDWTFTLRNLTVAGLRSLIRDEVRAGAVITLAPSLDQNKLLAEYEGGRLKTRTAA